MVTWSIHRRCDGRFELLIDGELWGTYDTEWQLRSDVATYAPHLDEA